MAANYIPFHFDFNGDYAIYQGVYLERAFTITQTIATMLSGRSIVMQVRKSSGDTAVLLEFTLGAADIVIDTLTLTIKKDADLMTLKPGDYVYDMNAYNTAEDNVKIMRGTFKVLPTVTR